MLKIQREHYNIYTFHKYIWISLAWLHTVQHLGRFFSFLICTHKNIHHHLIFLFHWGIGIRIYCSIRHITGLNKIALDNIKKKMLARPPEMIAVTTLPKRGKAKIIQQHTNINKHLILVKILIVILFFTEPQK